MFTFERASSFNQDISNWDIANVSTTESMFQNASSFNRFLGKWTINQLTNMTSMFNGCNTLNQSFYNWNTTFILSNNEITITKPNSNNIFSNCPNLEFYYANGNVTDNTIKEAYVLYKNKRSEYDLKHRDFTMLDTIAITNIDNLFINETEFNIDISTWNTSNVTSMKSVFQGAINFNQSLEKWQLSKVTSMNSMFLGAIRFNRPVNNWDVSNIIDASGAFMNAFSFSQDIYNWKMIRCIDFTNMFNGCVRLQASNLTLDVSTNFETNNNFYMQLLID
jgi:hypothetical protein